MRTLVTVPSLDMPGGVANYYRTLRQHLPEDIEYFTVGSKGDSEGIVSLLTRSLKDYRDFYNTLKQGNHDLVHLNPSLGPKAMIRDGIFLLVAKACRKKVIVFMRGWDTRCEQAIRKYFLPVFRHVYWKSDAFIVLGTEFRDKLVEMQYPGPVFIETTVADDSIFSRSRPDSQQDPGMRPPDNLNILMLTRIERSKGVYEAIDTFRILKQAFPSISLTIAGDGPELQNLKQLTSERQLRDIDFPGFVTGEHKRTLYEDSHIFLFPTFYGEGMPNAVLEAMAYGLPVVTRPVGGIADFFENGRMGFLTESLDAETLSGLVRRLITDSELRMQMSKYNREYARDNFRASVVSTRLQGIYEEVLGVAETS